MAVIHDFPVPRDPAHPARIPSGESGSLSDAEFTSTVEAVTSAFGDPTRRRIYLAVRERPEGVTASGVAEEFALHANVARHHLDKLAVGGYVEVFVVRSANSAAGRPSKRYRVSARTPGVERPRHGDDLLVLLLGQALSLVPSAEAEAMAERVGEEYGKGLAAQMKARTQEAGEVTSFGAERDGGKEGAAALRQALNIIAEALSAQGFAAHAEARGGSLALIKDRCPFFDTARQNPVICAVDRGMVRGMLASLYAEAVPTSAESSRARGDQACVTVTPLR